MRSLPSIRLARAISCLLLAAAVSACSIFTKQDREYLGAKATAPLKIPPDLSAPRPNPETQIPPLPKGDGGGAPATGLDVPPQVALESNDINVMRDGALRWLLVQSSEDDLWQRVKGFWVKDDIALAYDNSDFYVMETGWVAPGAARGQPADAGTKDGGARVRFRVRLVQFPDEDGTELYLTAYDRKQAPDGGAGAQPARTADTVLEDRMLKRLVEYLGGPSVNAAKLLTQSAPRKIASLADDKGQGLFLTLELAPEMAWRHVAEAVDRLGYMVIGHAREKKYDLEGASGAGPAGGDQAKAKTGAGARGKGKSTLQPPGHRDAADHESKDYDQYGHKYLISTSLPQAKPEKKESKGWFSWLFFSHSDTPAVAPDITLSLAPTGKAASRLTTGDDPSTGAKTQKDRKILKDLYESLD